ncbi:hypothetical protein ASE01_12660 [Nocardioides sp. Root190]|nr:hypothetical protein ASE01_12660 [Nocardioides sp. Root190]
MRGALVALVLGLPLLATVVVGAPVPAHAAAPSLGITPRTPVVGDTVQVTTVLPTRVRRPAQLQRATAGRWVTVARGTSTASGRVSVRVRLTATRTSLRVLVPAYRTSGRRLPALVSRTSAVSAARETVTLTTRIVGGRAEARILTSHLLTGRPVQLQQRTDGAWTSLATARIGSSRLVVITTALAAARGRSLRVLLPAYAGRSAVVSAVQAPPTVAVVAVTEGEQVRVDAVTTGVVQRVRFHADGVLIAEDTTAPWSASWTPRVGRHDVVARAIGPLDSVLSDAADVRTTAAPVTADSGVAEGYAIEVVQNGLELPTSATTLSSGAVLVTEKSGLVKVVEPGESGWALPREVLDLRADVFDGGDAGLIGIVADPDVATNGHVYLSLVRDDGEAGAEGAGVRRTQQVVRYTWDGTALDPTSRHVVLGAVTGPACSAEENIRTPDCLPLVGEAHTIGDLVFDDEGNLLIGVGDGALHYTSNGLPGRLETLRAQDPDVLAGKVLRVDPATGQGVPGNPGYDGDGASNASRVLALGLRNPFRFTLHDGHLVIGEVGEGTVEEVDVVELHDLEEPANFGWPCREGEEPTALGDVADEESPWHACAAVRSDGATLASSYSYDHTGAGGSISGGVFLDSEAYPAAMRGRYVFGDYAQGFIRTAEISHGGGVSDVAVLADASAAEGPVKFFTGPDGLVWTVSITTGALRRIRWSGAGLADQCPVGTFRRTFHDLGGPDSPFDEEVPPGEYSWLLPHSAIQLPAATPAPPTCESGIQLVSEDRRFGAAWRGRVELEAGTHRFTVAGSEWVRLWVDDEVVHDFWSNGFWQLPLRQHDVVLGAGQHVVRAELIHGDGSLASADVSWTRVGGPPSVALTAPANGAVAANGEVPWQIEVSDPDGDSAAALAAATQLEVDFLHYTGATFHAHPSTRIPGQLAGTLPVSDVHAPGSGVVRLRASVVDASGARSLSAPVYVCFAGGSVGPCQT